VDILQHADGSQREGFLLLFQGSVKRWASILVAGGTDPNRLWVTNDGGKTWIDYSSMGTGTATCVYQTSKALILTDLSNSGAVS
jgi:hypothetical protein